MNEELCPLTLFSAPIFSPKSFRQRNIPMFALGFDLDIWSDQWPCPLLLRICSQSNHICCRAGECGACNPVHCWPAEGELSETGGCSTVVGECASIICKRIFQTISMGRVKRKRHSRLMTVRHNSSCWFCCCCGFMGKNTSKYRSSWQLKV